MPYYSVLQCLLFIIQCQYQCYNYQVDTFQSRYTYCIFNTLPGVSLFANAFSSFFPSTLTSFMSCISSSLVIRSSIVTSFKKIMNFVCKKKIFLSVDIAVTVLNYVSNYIANSIGVLILLAYIYRTKQFLFCKT